NAYSAGRLAAVIATKRSNFLSFLTRKDVYNEDKLHADEEALRQFYYNRGCARAAATGLRRRLRRSTGRSPVRSRNAG
ncbi:POTRA domain-containing protein, partial [Rhizobium ruizarguesonis]